MLGLGTALPSWLSFDFHCQGYNFFERFFIDNCGLEKQILIGYVNLLGKGSTRVYSKNYDNEEIKKKFSIKKGLRTADSIGGKFLWNLEFLFILSILLLLFLRI